MMVEPRLTELEKRVDSKYTLVSLAAKRARQLIDGDQCLAAVHPTEKPVSLAMHEIAEDKIGNIRTTEGIK